MHTMHHRTAGTVKVLPAAAGVTVLERTASASKSATATTATHPRRKKHAYRRPYRHLHPPSDMALAIGSTVVLTVITVLTVLKVYAAVSEHPTHAQQQQQQQQPKNDDWVDTDKLPFNPLYTVPGSLETVGDRSDAYVRLRQRTDPLLPADDHRSLEFVRALSSGSAFALQQLAPAPQDFHHSDQLVPQYDIYNCPDEPPPGYPFQWPLLDLLHNWPADTVDAPASNQIHQGLCVFDYRQDYDRAVTYRTAEVPFVVVNDPAVAATVERWSQPGYLRELLREEPHRTEHSDNNHFMYYVPVSDKKNKKNRRRRNNRNAKRPGITRPDGWKEPTKLLRMPYSQWLARANVTEDKLGPDQPHWYYRLIGCGAMGNDGSCDQASSEYLFDELPFFQPRDDQLYIVEPDEQKGIHCRFGMKGVIAENHFDGSRNAIAVLGGSRRYILSHPNQCDKLALYPKGHPSARHSAVDWSDPDLAAYPEFAEATANEVVLTAGQVLYLPTEWFHFIVSLELNFQCNSRSGITNHFKEHIHRCGF